MNRIMRMTAIALIALCGLGRAATAQGQAPQGQDPQGQFTGKVNVNEVLLDVLVTDAKGNVIVGLDKNDFVVRDHGNPVELTGATFYSNRRLLESNPTLAKQGVSTEQGTEDRYFILFFEDQKDTAQEAPRLISQQLEAAKRARGWVDGDMLPNDWVAVVSYDTRLKVQQDFTHDRKALVAAIGDAMKGKDPEGNYPSRIDTTKGPSLLAGLPKGKELRNKTPKIYDALQAIARSAGNIRGRKNLLLFTFGLPANETTFGQFVPDKRYFLPTVRRAQRQQRGGLLARPDAPGGRAHAERLAEPDVQRHRRPLLLQRHQLLDAARPDRQGEQRLLPAELPERAAGRQVGLPERHGDHHQPRVPGQGPEGV